MHGNHQRPPTWSCSLTRAERSPASFTENLTAFRVRHPERCKRTAIPTPSPGSHCHPLQRRMPIHASSHAPIRFTNQRTTASDHTIAGRITTPSSQKEDHAKLVSRISRRDLPDAQRAIVPLSQPSGGLFACNRLRGRMSFRLRQNDTANNGGERIRTDDPLLAKQVLSQLSYTPVALKPHEGTLSRPVHTRVVGQGGLEPPTPRLSSVCSNQLSY